MTFDSKTSEVKDHATFSASGAERWLNCPGSIRLSEQAPEQAESKYALEGTEAHACLEFLLKNRLRLKAAKKAAAKKYDPDMIEHAEAAVRWVEDRLAAYPGAELLCETRVDSSPFTCADQFGTLDISIVQEFGTLTIVDYKYGAGYAVDPEGARGQTQGIGNPQLAYYGLAVSHQYEHNFAEVELVVIQPRAYHESGDVIRAFKMSMEDLLAWGPIFKKGVNACERADAAFVSGSWCRWCPAAIICPELKTASLKKAQIVFSDTKGVESVPEPTLAKIPSLSVWLDACDQLEAWIGKVREHAEHVLSRGIEVPGFKLVAKRSPRRWVDDGTLSDEAREKFGDKAFTEPKLLSPAQLEKAARSTQGIDEWVSARTTAESSGTTLVRETDKRPAVRPMEKVFGTVDAEVSAPLVLQGRIPKVKKRF